MANDDEDKRDDASSSDGARHDGPVPEDSGNDERTSEASSGGASEPGDAEGDGEPRPSANETLSRSSPAEPAAAALDGPSGGAKSDVKRLSAGARLAAAKAAKAAAKQAKKEARRAEQQPKPAEPSEQPQPDAAGPEAELEQTELGRVALRAGRWWESNQRLGWIAIAAVSLVIVGALAWMHHADTESRAAGALLEEAVEIAGARVTSDAEPSSAEEGDAPRERTFPTARARDEAALEAYRRIVEVYPSHPAAGLARLGMGKALMALGRYDEAAAAYDEAFRRHGSSSHVGSQALEGLGYAREAAGDLDEARSAFERLAEFDEQAHALLARYHLARLMIARGERDQARTALRELVDALRSDMLDDTSGPRRPYVLAEAEARLRELDPSASTSTRGLLGGAPLDGEGGGIDPETLQRLIRQMQERSGEDEE